MIKEFDGLFSKCSSAFKQYRSALRTHNLAYGLLNCLGRHTLTGMITSSGHQFVDWSSVYRLFQGNRVNIDSMFSVITSSLLNNKFCSNQDENIYSHMDDTLLNKTGRKVFGTSWRRDRLVRHFIQILYGDKDSFRFLCHYPKNREHLEAVPYR